MNEGVKFICCGNEIEPEPRASEVDGSPMHAVICPECGRHFFAAYPSGFHRWTVILKGEYHWNDREIHDKACNVVGEYNHPFSHHIRDERKDEFEEWLEEQGVRHCFRFVRSDGVMALDAEEKESEYSTDAHGCEEAQ